MPASTRPHRPGAFGLALALAGVGLGIWFAVVNEASVAELALVGFIGLAAGAGAALLRGGAFIAVSLLVVVGVLIVLAGLGRESAPLWPFAVFLGMSLTQQISPRR